MNDATGAGLEGEAMLLLLSGGSETFLLGPVSRVRSVGRFGVDLD